MPQFSGPSASEGWQALGVGPQRKVKNDPRSPSRPPHAVPGQGLDDGRRPVAGARHRRQHGALQRHQRSAAQEVPVRDPDSLVRLRWSGRNDMVTSSSDYGYIGSDDSGRNVRVDVLVPDVPAVRRRQPDDDGSLRVRAVRPRQRRRGRPGRHRHVVHLVRQLLPRARRQRESSAARSCRKTTSRPRRLWRSMSARYWRSRFRRRSAGGRQGRSASTTCRSRSSACCRRTSRRIQQTVGDPPDVAVPLALDAQLSTRAAPSKARA